MSYAWVRALALTLGVIGVALPAARATTSGAATSAAVGNDYAFPYFNQHHPVKAVIEVPSDPAHWPAVPLVITHNLVSLIGHGVPYKVVLVAPGPAIAFFEQKKNPTAAKLLQRLHELGVRMYACHAAMLAFHVKQSQFFPYVGVAHPSGVTTIFKYEAKGYVYYTLP